MLKIEDLNTYKSDKILSLNEIVKKISELKSKGKTVGLCHGGFDLLHPGHAKHFESAKNLCDILVVSVTSDKYVESRKGSGRPIFTDKLRAYMIASLSSVDFAVISDFKTGIEVINLLKPSFYIKGPDFINKTTPGITGEKKAIQDAGGEIKYTNDPKLGTTEIINYIKEIDSKKLLIGIDRDGTIIKNNDFFGKNPDWAKEIEFNEDVINSLSYLQTKYKTTKVIVTNQAGVARRLFDCKRVEEINSHIHSHLSSKGVLIDDWQYCSHIDSAYASRHPELDLNPEFVKPETKRKPKPDMLFDALKKLNKTLSDFDKIIIIGNAEDDKKLAENLNAKFIDVNNKTCQELISEFEAI